MEGNSKEAGTHLIHTRLFLGVLAILEPWRTMAALIWFLPPLHTASETLNRSGRLNEPLSPPLSVEDTLPS